MSKESGPGKISVEDVGAYTIAKTTLLDARRIMAYAAGINDTNEAYFNDLRPEGLSVHPGIAFSLQWNARFQVDRELNARAAAFGVHAESDLRIHRPFRQGEAITTQGRTVARRQIPPGVYSVDRYRMTSSDGELVAELDYNGIIRGGILDGESRELASSPVRPSIEEASGEPLWSEEIYIAPHAGQQYTECADIFNPIHTEPSVAKGAGLPGVILHGSATKAHALTTIIDRCFDGEARRIRRLCGQLRAMVLMDTTIRVDCLAIDQLEDETRVFFRVLNEQGEAAVANGVVCGVSIDE
jgi:acyl dehydratase